MVTGLIFSVLVIFLAAAYGLVQTSLLRAGRERAQAAADQLAGLFAQTSQRRLAEIRTAAADGAIRRFVEMPGEATREAALERIRKIATSGSQVIELWDNGGHQLLRIAVPSQVDPRLPAAERPTAPGYGPFRAANDAVFSDLVAEVPRGAGPSQARPADRVGYLVVRRVSSTAGASDVLGRLVGTGATVAVGNQAGGTWTDLSKIVPAPGVELHRSGAAEIRDDTGVRRIGALAVIAGTPWAVWVDFPRSAVVAPAYGFLVAMSIFLVLVTFLSAASAVALTRRITTPLADLTAAAEAVADGHYSQRVTTSRRDEVGRLAGAFNAMAEHLADDMAARQRGEQELQARQAGLQAMFEGNPLPMWVYDLDTLEFLAVNDAAVELYGYARDEFLAMRIPDIRPADDVPRLLSDVGRPRATWQHSGVWRHRLRSGQIIDVDISSHTLTFLGRQSALVVAQDITERRRADLALRESEARKSAVMDGALDCIITMDHEGLITEFNPAAERTFGYDRIEAIGRPVADLIIPPPLRARHQEGLARLVATGEGMVLGKRIELPAMRRDGTEFPAELSIVVVRRDGPPVFTGFVRDLSEQKAAEDSRLRSLRLQEENKRVQEASRLKSEFLANMSHELRTPLNAIIGFAELLHDGEVAPDTPQFKEFLQDILTSGQHLLQLINDVLDLSKVEAGKLEFRPERLDVEQVVREVVNILRTTAATRRVRVRVEVEAEVRDAVLDRGRLKQVLYNYVSNALKFTPEGGAVTVRARGLAEGLFRLEVEDTGIGIADEDIGRLFVEFHQLAAGAAKKHAGTGLGLALTKRLVEAQGGAVGVRSRVGHGSTFWADLPRRAAANPASLESRVFPAASAAAPTILIIEDDPRDQDLLVRTLVEAGFAVQTAMTGAQAIDLLQRHTFDAITLDLLLPDMSGVDVLKTIHRDHRNNRVPIIVVTIVSETGAVAGFSVHDVFPKPCHSDELLLSLRRAGVVARPGETILVIDDDPGSLRLMAATLERAGYESICVQDGPSGLREAEQAPPAMVILDLLMPGMTGLQFLERFRQLPHCRLTPVFVWTVKDLTQEEYQLLKGSAQGVIPKGQEGARSVVAELQRFLDTGQPG